MLTEGSDEVAVSTIVENLFQYFDDDLIAENGQYSQLERGLKLRAALLVFADIGLAQPSGAEKSLIILADVGLAQPSEADKSLPMWVPTRHFWKAVGMSRLTTAVKPLHLPACIDISRREADKFYDYAVDLERSLDDETPEYLVRMKIWLRMSELGWAEHGRGNDERLYWKLTKSGIENRENGTMVKLLLGERYGKN